MQFFGHSSIAGRSLKEDPLPNLRICPVSLELDKSRMVMKVQLFSGQVNDKVYALLI